MKQAGKEFGRIPGFFDLNAQPVQLLRIQGFDPCTPPPDLFAAPRKLPGSVNLDRQLAAGAHRRIFRTAPWTNLDPFHGIENESSEACRLNCLQRLTIALQALACEHIADNDK